MPRSSPSSIDSPSVDDGRASADFCVVCGRTGRPLVDGVCADCFASQHPLIRTPQRAVVTICPTCGARRVRQHWERADSSPQLTEMDLTPLLDPLPEVGVHRVHWQETGRVGTIGEYVGTAEVSFRGGDRTVEVSLDVRVESRTCPECSRRSGHYYTALLQLRAAPGDAREKPKELKRRLENAFVGMLPDARAEWRKAIAWREELPEGWNYYFTDTLAARAMAKLAKRRFDAGLTESAKLVGRKDGRDTYRVTFCLRIPAHVAS